MEDYSLAHLIDVYQKKYPHNDIEAVKEGLTNFTTAEEMPDAICLKGRTWEYIKDQILLSTKQ